MQNAGEMQNAECRMQNERGLTSFLSFCILHSAFCILHSAFCISFCILIPLCGFLFYYRLADRDLWSSHEARAAMDGQGVLDGSAVLVPHLFDGRSELQKPPLYYWLVAAFGWLGGGIDAWAVRLPAAISATACVFGLALFGRACGRGRAGLLAAVMLATAAHFTWLARIGRIDMPLTLTTGISACAAFFAIKQPCGWHALTSGWHALTVGKGVAERHVPTTPFQGVPPNRATPFQGVPPDRTTPFQGVPPNRTTPIQGVPPDRTTPIQGVPPDRTTPIQGVPPNRFALSVAYLSAAVGVLLKGPIGFILPAAAVAAFLVGEGEWPAAWEFRDWRELARRLGMWWGVPLVLLLTLPWFLAADEDTGGELFRVFFWYHNVERALGGGPLRSNPWWFYGPQFVVDFLPWSPLFIGAVVWAWRRGLLRDDPLARFGLAWFVGILVVLSCARFKRADYLLPAYPGASLFLGCVAARVGAGRGWLVNRLIPTALAGAMVVVWAVRVTVVLPAEEPFRNYRPLAEVIRRAAPEPQEVVFFRTEAHALAFRVGRPLAVLVEWSDLEDRLGKPGPHYVVTPPPCVAECRARLAGLSWEAVTGTVELAGGAHERPLVLLRVTHPDAYVSTNP
jgi:4-amino-4-deoxy-L-arabinose transferase-like glycosyltransferase